MDQSDRSIGVNYLSIFRNRQQLNREEIQKGGSPKGISLSKHILYYNLK